METMAYTRSGGTPWHGLGKAVDDNLSPNEMLAEAGLNWPVETRPIYDQDGNKITGFKELGRQYNGKFENFDIVGSKYQPIQNSEAFETFDRFIRSGDMMMETAGSLRNGKYVWGLAKTRDGFTLPGGDDVEGYLLCVKPHLRDHAFKVFFTPTRVVCMNTLSMALNGPAMTGTYRHRHDRKYDEAARADMEQVIGLTAKQMTEYQEMAEFLASVKMKEADLLWYLGRVFLEKPEIERLDEKNAFPTRLDDAYDLPSDLLSGRNAFLRVIKNVVGNDPGNKLESARGTYWGAFNIVTYAFDHFLGNASRSSNDNGDFAKQENRMYNATLGDAAGKKLKALELAVEWAKKAA
jgi:phage/plasmid-like protein (TIGR03299 family)